jgi:hypothetical protein
LIVAVVGTAWTTYQFARHVPGATILVTDADYYAFDLPSQFYDGLRELDAKNYQEKKGSHFATQFANLSAQFVVSLRDTGDLGADDVRVQLDASGTAALHWNDGTKQQIEFVNEIPIGRLGIQKSVKITAWLNNTLFSWKEPLVVHNSGAQPIQLPKKLMEEPATIRVSTLVVILLIGTFGALSIWAKYMESRMKRERIAEENESPQGLAPPPDKLQDDID